MQPFLTVKSQYAVGRSFWLFRPSARASKEMVLITVVRSVDVGYGKNSQSLIAFVNEGPANLHGKNVFIKFYDPLYLNPDFCKTIRIFSTIFPVTDSQLSNQHHVHINLQPTRLSSRLAAHHDRPVWQENQVQA
jgi:hypothetical protein